MSKPIQIIPEVLGVPVTAFDASAPFITDAFAVNLGFQDSWHWSFVAVDNTAGGNPQYTVEASNDDSNWFEYGSASTNVSLGTPLMDNKLPWIYFRINYDGGASSGTTSMEITLKHH